MNHISSVNKNSKNEHKNHEDLILKQSISNWSTHIQVYSRQKFARAQLFASQSLSVRPPVYPHLPTRISLKGFSGNLNFVNSEKQSKHVRFGLNRTTIPWTQYKDRNARLRAQVAACGIQRSPWYCACVGNSPCWQPTPAMTGSIQPTYTSLTADNSNTYKDIRNRRYANISLPNFYADVTVVVDKASYPSAGVGMVMTGRWGERSGLSLRNKISHPLHQTVWVSRPATGSTCMCSIWFMDIQCHVCILLS
jgi:hypothetical protein